MREPVPELPVRRIVDAMVLVVGERGFAGTTVGAVCARAGVSRGTFYDTFDGLQECFLAVLDEGQRRVSMLMSEAFEGRQDWQEGLHAALVSLLLLLDSEPALARVLLVEALGAGAWALEHRALHLAALARMIVERWPTDLEIQSDPLVMIGVMESALGMIAHSHLLTDGEQPAIALLGQLMGMIVAVYIGAESAAAQIEREVPLTRALLAERHTRLAVEPADEVDIPSALRDPRAHRARSCLVYLARHPGASNRQVARAAGVGHREQVCKILARLHALGLLFKCPGPPGGANAWSLTPHGLHVSRALRIGMLGSGSEWR
jgi:AcrR family transcriptional regulator